MDFNIHLIVSKCLKLHNSLNNEITASLQTGNVETRPAKSNGVSCPLLLPLVLIIYTWLDEVSLLYKIMAYVSVGLLFYSVLFLIFLSTSCLVLKEPVYGGCVPSGLISTVLIYVYLKQDFKFSIFVSVLSTYMFSSLLRILLRRFQKTFTVGEAMIVSQGITLLTVMSVTRYVFNITETNKEMEFINTLIHIVLLTVALAAVLLNMLPDTRRDITGLIHTGVQCAIFALILLHYTFGIYCLLKIINVIFVVNNRWTLILFWLLLVACAIFGLLQKSRMEEKADTVARKLFHILASVVFTSGVLMDANFMMLAAGVGFGVIILVEVLRKSDIEPISSTLQKAFFIYCDEKDCGHFAMTPLYLYCGLWLPLLVTSSPLERLSGVLSTGVGDTAASWGGSRLGRHAWPNSKKTIEGTVLNALSQVLVVFFLQWSELLDEPNALPRIAIAATASALVEAKTEQVDNLVLPPVTLLAFQLTRFLTWQSGSSQGS